tara:strand:- start:4809 stop:5405 length:597 start_codon:yes stop_codon:yes gene_type:complete
MLRGSAGKDRYMGFDLTIDTRQTKAAIKEMERTAGQIMAQAIYDVLKGEIGPTQGHLKQQSSVRQQNMANKVADSLIVEIGEDQNQQAMVRFGSHPIDEGGVSGSRGGKLAQLLEYGATPFAYPFTFKTIENSATFGGGSGSTGFINAKTGKNMVHPGYKPVDFLSFARDRAKPKIGAAIVDAFNKAYGGGAGGNSNY